MSLWWESFDLNSHLSSYEVIYKIQTCGAQAPLLPVVLVFSMIRCLWFLGKLSFTFLLMLETRLFLTKGYLNIKSWEICFNQVWQTARALKDTSFVGTGWGEKGVSDAPTMEELCEPGIRDHTGRGAHLCIRNLQETGLFLIWVSQQYLQMRCKWSLWNVWCPVEEILPLCPLGNRKRSVHVLLGSIGDHWTALNWGVQTSMTIMYTRRGLATEVNGNKFSLFTPQQI